MATDFTDNFWPRTSRIKKRIKTVTTYLDTDFTDNFSSVCISENPWPNTDVANKKMRDIWEEQLNWVDSGKPFVLARVIRTWRSAPRKSGAGMIIGKGMDKDSLPKVVGSVSGGCIEGAVIEEALDVLESGESLRLSF